MDKQTMILEVQNKLSKMGIKVITAQRTDILISSEFIDASWNTGKKKISYEASVYFDENSQTIFMWEMTKEVGAGFSFGGDTENTFQVGKTLFRKIKSIHYGPDGKAYEYDLDLGEIPKTFKETAKANGWKFETVLNPKKTLYPEGYSHDSIPMQKEQVKEHILSEQPEIKQTAKFPKGNSCDIQNATPRKSVSIGGVLFWIMWSILALFSIIMVTDEFSLARLVLSVALLIITVVLRKIIFKKFLLSTFCWFMAYIIFFIIIGFTPMDIKSVDAEIQDIDFTKYSDFNVESKESKKIIDTISQTAFNGAIEPVIKNIVPNKRDSYRKLFESNPEKLKIITGALKNAKLVYLSDPDKVNDYYPRIAEYEVQYDNNTFYIRMYKTNGIWLIDKL